MLVTLPSFLTTPPAPHLSRSSPGAAVVGVGVLPLVETVRDSEDLPSSGGCCVRMPLNARLRLLYRPLG